MPSDPLAIGPENDEYVGLQVHLADIIVCGWGKLGGDRGEEVLRLIRRNNRVPHALKLNKDGGPSPPLYLRADARPFPMEEGRA